MAGINYSKISKSEIGGGRALLLLLLFFIAVYNFINIGYNAFVIVCIIPCIFLAGYVFLKYKMALFWTLFTINFFVMFITRHFPVPIPTSMINEMFEIMLIGLALLDVSRYRFGDTLNVMFVMLLVWMAFCCIEIFNDACGIGIDVYRWYTGARLMSFQLIYALTVMTIYINTPKKLIRLLVVWACFILFAGFWVWKQQKIGLTNAEKSFIYNSPAHFMGGRIRYMSCFSDAANFGVHLASAAVMFIVVGIYMKIKRLRIFFLVMGFIAIWAFFSSGTRTAMACLIAGLAMFIILCKSRKVMLSAGTVFFIAFFFLAFTKIGNGNSQIRRMRTLFDKEDASMGVRDMNKATLRKYMTDAPWGVGIGLENSDVPPFNKFRLITQVPPDSEYVYIWVRTGKVGLTVFIITTVIMFLGACIVVWFRIRSDSLRGIGIGFTCAFFTLHLGGYANQILMQFPNVLIFYGGLALVYALPAMEEAWNKWESEELAKQEERKRLRLEKKRASRV